MINHRRFLHSVVPAVLLGGVIVMAVSPVLAESNRVISVEEHWELQLAEPDADRSAPQTTMVMSPTGDVRIGHTFHRIWLDYNATQVQEIDVRRDSRDSSPWLGTQWEARNDRLL